MTPADIAKVAYAAGVRDRGALASAVAIAIAESGGNERAHNGRGLDDSYGLWQINMHGDKGPDRRKRFGLSSNDQLYDPATNAKAMAGISNGGRDWSPWSTYRGLRYLAVLPVATAAASAVAATGAAGAAVDAATGGALDAAREAAGLAIKASSWASDRNNWVRVSKVFLGLMLAGGAILVISGRPVIGTATKVAGLAITKGKAAAA